MSEPVGCSQGGEPQERPAMGGDDRERACRCHYPHSHLSFIPDAAGGSQGHCYPLRPPPVLPGTGTSSFQSVGHFNNEH